MSPVAKVGIGMGGAILLVMILPFIPGLIKGLLILGILGAPVAAYFMLSPEQRRRIGRMRKRGQIGR